MKLLVDLVYVWWILFGAFWLSVGLIFMPWQLTVGNDFDLRHPLKKLRASALIAAFQLIPYWLLVFWPASHGGIHWLMPTAALVAGMLIVVGVQHYEPEGPSRWDELEWVATVQAGVLFLAGLAYVLA